MKRIILVLAVLGMFQTAIAQTKKKTATKAKTSVTTVKPKPEAKTNAVASQATTSKTNSSKTVSSKKLTSSSYFDKSDFQLNAAIGVSGWGIPIYVGADYGVADDISVGAEVSYRSFKEKDFFYNYNATIIGIGANGNYHFGRLLQTPKEWDLYAGLGLNYYIWTFDNNNYLGTNSSGIALGGQVGARYFFNKNFALNAELGGASATSAAKIGITFKL